MVNPELLIQRPELSAQYVKDSFLAYLSGNKPLGLGRINDIHYLGVFSTVGSERFDYRIPHHAMEVHFIKGEEKVIRGVFVSEQNPELPIIFDRKDEFDDTLHFASQYSPNKPFYFKSLDRVTVY